MLHNHIQLKYHNCIFKVYVSPQTFKSPKSRILKFRHNPQVSSISYSGYFSGGKIFVVFRVKRRTTKFYPRNSTTQFGIHTLGAAASTYSFSQLSVWPCFERMKLIPQLLLRSNRPFLLHAYKGCGLVYRNHENISTNWPKIHCSRKFYPPNNTRYMVLSFGR